ncbi:MAG: polysaccharide biosynthesis tyrosine autokinase [Oscillospiraceae bacterium]|nr:polysaccharide biosynthesis tyrosine autokinase [Oscillospiraceae bacterium]
MDKTNEMNTSVGGLLPFDPIVLLRDVAKRWLVIVLVALILGTGAYISTDMSYKPVYKTSTTFVVTSRGSSTTVYSNLSSTSSLANLFTGLLNSSIMRKTVAQEMGVSGFDGTISTAVIPNTNLITMTVTASDPRTAFLVAQTLIDHHEELTYQVVDGILLEVLQYPTVPIAPSNYANASGEMKDMMFMGAVATAVVLAVLSFMRDAVRSGTEAKEKLDCDFLGEIPHEQKYKTVFARLSRRKTSILITNPVTSFHFVETIRKLRRRVEQHMDGGKVLMVSSLLENEGKSTVAVNLALAMAQKHKRVLLIDCDLRKPACHAVLDQQKFTSGIKEVLQNKASLSDSILRYKKTNLYMLLAKKGDRNVGDLIASDRMNALLDWARESFDFIILDLPPMSAASDTEGMANLADACLMVVRQNAAVAPALNKAIASLEGHSAKMLGCVLNNVYSTRLSSGTGYGYGYGYGYGGYKKYYGHYGNYASGGSRK